MSQASDLSGYQVIISEVEIGCLTRIYLVSEFGEWLRTYKLILFLVQKVFHSSYECSGIRKIMFQEIQECQESVKFLGFLLRTPAIIYN